MEPVNQIKKKKKSLPVTRFIPKYIPHIGAKRNPFLKWPSFYSERPCPPASGAPHCDCSRGCSLPPSSAHKQLIKGTVGPDWICMEWYHWISLEKDINRYRLFIFYFWSWISDKSSKFWATSCKNESNLLLVWITVCMCSNHYLFRRTMLQKCGRDINCSLDYGSWVKNSNIPQSKPK